MARERKKGLVEGKEKTMAKERKRPLAERREQVHPWDILQ
jgi:hypothetical protein